MVDITDWSHTYEGDDSGKNRPAFDISGVGEVRMDNIKVEGNEVGISARNIGSMSLSNYETNTGSSLIIRDIEKLHFSFVSIVSQPLDLYRVHQIVDTVDSRVDQVSSDDKFRGSVREALYDIRKELESENISHGRVRKALIYVADSLKGITEKAVGGAVGASLVNPQAATNLMSAITSLLG